MTHLAIDTSFTVVAQFSLYADCAQFCSGRNLTHLPFNSAKHSVPAVGSKYAA
jgi:hypothetical protein